MKISLCCSCKFLACECNAEGSESTQCAENGKCTCKPNVTGDKCDQCADGYNGFPTCQVIIDDKFSYAHINLLKF